MSEIKMLPLPKWLLEGFTDPTIERLCDYARANVAHATAEKDAEIEALRAEVLRLRTDNSESFRDAAILANIRRDEAEARAERLAEALRECVKDMQRTEDYYGEHPEAQEVISKARAALRDHDQEARNG